MPLKAIAIPSMPFKIRGFLRCHQFLFSIPYVPFPSLFSQAASAASRPYPFLQFRQATRAEARRLQVPPAISPVPFLSGCCFGAREGGGPGIRWADVYRVGSLASTPTFCSPSMVMVELSGVAAVGATSLVNKDHPRLWRWLVHLLR